MPFAKSLNAEVCFGRGGVLIIDIEKVIFLSHTLFSWESPELISSKRLLADG